MLSSFQLGPEDVADPYEPPEKKVQVSARVRQSTKDMVEAVMRVWQYRAKLDGADPEDVDLTFTLERLVRSAAIATLQDLGGKPETEAEWEALFRRLKTDFSKK